MRAVISNIEILKTSAPSGVWIKCFEDRMDLLSIMIEGPRKTPYENGLFIFDIHLPSDFPYKPPSAHCISFYQYRLNPNLYVEGKECVSLLGTWQAEEQWRPTSTLLQLIVSIQGLILVKQPYFNEPGYANQFGTTTGLVLVITFVGQYRRISTIDREMGSIGKERTPEGNLKSTAYNEDVIIGMIDSTTALINNPPSIFKKEIFYHFARCGAAMYERLKTAISEMGLQLLEQLESLRCTINNNVYDNVNRKR